MKTKIKEQNLNVIDLFKQFCKERHTEDKGRNFDMLQEIYAKTELFDLSFLPNSKEASETFKTMIDDMEEKREIPYKTNSNECIINSSILKNFSLPFDSQFLRVVSEPQLQMCVFLREYSPFIITGTSYSVIDEGKINSTFRIDIEKEELVIDLNGIYSYYAYIKKYIGQRDKKDLLSRLQVFYFVL